MRWIPAGIKYTTNLRLVQKLGRRLGNGGRLQTRPGQRDYQLAWKR